MNKATNMKHLLAVLVGMALLHTPISLAAEPGSPTNGFAFESRDGALAISFGGQRVADYVYRDEKIPRPYFANLCAPGGIQVTRNHPPVAWQGPDRPRRPASGRVAGVCRRQRPGLLAEPGRHQTRTVHRAARRPRWPPHLRHREPDADDQRPTPLHAALAHHPRRAARRLSADLGRHLCGDGAGHRLRRPGGNGLGRARGHAHHEKNGGLITSSTGAKTAKATWGKAFDWCDYSGVIDGQRVGVTLMPDPANFRPSWFHNRNYGLMVANPFGRKSMKQGDVSRVEVKKGEKLRLRFGLLLHAAAPDRDVDLAAAYRDFLSQLPKPTP